MFKGGQFFVGLIQSHIYLRTASAEPLNKNRKNLPGTGVNQFLQGTLCFLSNNHIYFLLYTGRHVNTITNYR